MSRAALTLVAVAFALAAGAESDGALPPPGEAGWRPIEFPRVSRHTVYERSEGALRARSECSASGLSFPLAKLDLARTPILRWRWRVDQVELGGDPRTRAGDDFAARVYVLFAPDREREGVLTRTRRALGRALYGQEMPGIVLNYVISEREPPGTRWDNPYAAESKMISRGAPALGAWREEEADVAADYRTIVGVDPPPVLGVALMSDSDDSCGSATAWFSDLRFAARGE